MGLENDPTKNGKNLEVFLKQKVAFRLQMLRDAIFRESIRDVIDRDANKNFFGEHNAATYNYYYGKKMLCASIGLPPSVSELDHNYQSFALKNKNDKILEEFHKRYTPLKMIQVIYDAINNPEDQSIKSALFTDWLLQESQLDPEQFMLEEEDKKGVTVYSYNPITVIHLLKRLQLIN